MGFVLLTGLIPSNALRAQLGGLEVKVARSWGAPSFSDHLLPGYAEPGSALGDMYDASAVANPVGTTSAMATLSIGGGWSVGASVGSMAFDKTAMYWNRQPHSGSDEITIHEEVSTFMGCVVKRWGKSPTGLFSEVHIGAGHYLFTSNAEAILPRLEEWHPGFQLTPLGLRVGGQFAVDLRLGYGSLGVFGIGVSWSAAKRDRLRPGTEETVP